MLYIDCVAPSLDHCLFHCKLYQNKRLDFLKTNRLPVYIYINLTNHLMSIPVACLLSDFVEQWNHHYGTVVTSSSSSINVSGSNVGHFRKLHQGIENHIG